jgi:hypothetical protein
MPSGFAKLIGFDAASPSRNLGVNKNEFLLLTGGVIREIRRRLDAVKGVDAVAFEKPKPLVPELRHACS